MPDHAGPVGHGRIADHPEGNTTVRYRALDAAGNAARGVAAEHDAQPGGRRRRDRGPPGEHQRPRRRRRARHQHRRERRDGDDRSRSRPRRASPAPNVTLDVAADEGARGRHGGRGVPAVPHDRRADRHPAADAPRWPATVVNNRVGHSRCVTPDAHGPDARAPAAPAVRDAWLDGTWTYPLPLDASQLSLGKHTCALGVADNAGNGDQDTFTFLVTTSFADIDALLTRYGTAGTIPAADVTALKADAGRGQDRQRRRRRRRGDRPAARPSPPGRRRVSNAKARNLLVDRRAGAHPRQERGITVARPGRPRHRRPSAYAGAAAPPVRAPGAADQQPEREVQGPRDLQPLGRLPPPGDRGRPRPDPAARPPERLRRRPVGLQLSRRVAQRHAVHERRRPRASTRSSSGTRPWARTRSGPRTR